MAILPQMNIFSWREIDACSDLLRLRYVLDAIPDEPLMQLLEDERGRGRNDYPVRPVWNSVLAGVVFQHVSIESLRRELLRNGQLRDVCGFSPDIGMAAVPPPSAYTHFFESLFRHEDAILRMFQDLVDSLGVLLPDFGARLAVDGKAVPSAGKPNKGEADGRRETDADWGTKTYRGEKDGKYWEKVKRWFGFKLHLIVDSQYELPVAWHMTRASVSDTTQVLPLMKDLSEKHPGIVDRAGHITADRGYDSAENNRDLWNEFAVKPVIDTRAMWKDGEKTRPLYPDRADNIVYDERGGIYCMGPSAASPIELETRPMAFSGFEASRGALKYRCPAAAQGLECPLYREGTCGGCGKSEYGRVVRVPLTLDERIFIPVPRDSPKWDRLYAERTAVERVNSRLDVSFGFERHYIRGLAKMRVRMGLALVVMLAMAVGSIRSGQKERMRSLVRPFQLPKAA